MYTLLSAMPNCFSLLHVFAKLNQKNQNFRLIRKERSTVMLP